MSLSGTGVTEGQDNFNNLHSLLVSGLEFLEKKEYLKSQVKQYFGLSENKEKVKGDR